MLDLLEPFDLKYSATDTDGPFSLTGCMTLLGTGNVIITNYLADKSEDIANDRVVSMLRKIS